jgi:protein TonB
MTPKKNPLVSIQKERPLFTILGLVISFAIAFITLSFTYYPTSSSERIIHYFPDDGVIIPATHTEPQKRTDPIPKPKIKFTNHYTLDDLNNPIEPNIEPNLDPIPPFTGFIYSDTTFKEKREDIEDHKILHQQNELDSKPEFKGGEDMLQKFIGDHITYPKNALYLEAEGIVMVTFVVEKDGSVSNVKLRGNKVGYDLDEEAIRVVKLFPKFKPGTYKKHPVRVQCSIPIEFILNY